MKKHLLLTPLIFFVTIASQAQWQPDVRLTNDPSSSRTSLNGARCIAASGDIVHVVWVECRDGNEEIYYKRSINAGISWETDKRLTVNSASSVDPSIAVFGSVVHIVWRDHRDVNPAIYYKRSEDGGISWGGDKRLTNIPSNSVHPSVSVYGLDIHVVWEEGREGTWKIYYKRSIDGGLTWGKDTPLTFDPSGSVCPSVAVFGSTVHVVWCDFRSWLYGEIYYKRSTDRGTSWGADTRLTIGPFGAGYPTVSAFGSTVQVVWNDYRDGANSEIYHKRSIDGGTSWEADSRLTNALDNSFYPSVSSSGLNVHVVWYDRRDGNHEIYYKRSTTEGLNWETDKRLTVNSSSGMPHIAVSGSVVHVVWLDIRNGNDEIYYKRNPMGSLNKSVNPIEIQPETNSIPMEYSLEQNYPNPFNPSTTIKFALPVEENVVINVSDITGKQVAELLNQKMQAGYHEIKFDGSNLSSGVYFYKITTSGFTDVKKMILVK